MNNIASDLVGYVLAGGLLASRCIQNQLLPDVFKLNVHFRQQASRKTGVLPKYREKDVLRTDIAMIHIIRFFGGVAQDSLALGG